MTRPQSPRPGPSRPVLATLVAFVLAVMTTTASAIPTPDVVVNVFTGMSQVLAIVAGAVATVIGGFWKTLRGGGRASSRLVNWVLGGALLLSVTGMAWQHQHATALETERMSRNLIRSSKQNGHTVKDTSLKELSRSDQLDHPLGMSTDEVDALSRSAGSSIVDVREREEFEAGSVNGAINRRYPDLSLDASELEGQGPIVLLCYSGNRSGELAAELAERGFDTRFMVGGLEKWVREAREMTGGKDASGGRDIASYPNKDVLLRTTEVEEAFAQGGVVFIDARYPMEFNAFHLPGAINIPLRKLTAAEVEEALSQVPAGSKLIGACYDKRSSFYALLLGSKLSARGHTWMGRYTLPFEFIEPAPAAADSSKPVMASISAPLNGWFGSVPSIALGIVLLVIALRVVILPLTLKAEASIAAERRIRPALDQLAAKYADDPASLRTEKQKLLHKAGVRPLWGLAAGLVQAVVFIGLATWLATASVVDGAPLMEPWISDLGQADPVFMLPVLVALLAFVQMKTTGKFRHRRGTMIALGLGGLFLALTAPLSAAVNLAIVTNLVCSVVQAIGVSRVGQKREQVRLQASNRVLPLGRAHRYDGVGPKAARLSHLRSAGLPVPHGFVLTHGCLQDLEGAPDTWPEARRKEILASFDRLGADRVAVRSSALDEDGEERSYAGVFESELDITRDNLFDAIASVYSSFYTDRAASYSEEDAQACILVQEMVDADHAGVVFTRHPRYPEEIAIEYVDGCGEKLVSGTAEPTRIAYGRRSLELVEGTTPPAFGPELLKLALKCEELFGRAQDVEWAERNGRVYLVQSRDITASALPEHSKAQAIERERRRLLALVDGNDKLRRDSFSELVSTPTPSSLSLLHRLLGRGGAAETARKRAGLPYAAEHSGEALVSTFGRLFVRDGGLAKLFPQPGLLARAKAGKRQDPDELASRWKGEVLPRFDRDVRLEQSRDLASLETVDLLEVIRVRTDLFACDHYSAVEDINIAAAQQQAAAQSLLRRHGLPESLLGWHRGRSVTADGEKLLRKVALGEAEMTEYLDAYGHRATTDYELSLPRFSEDPRPVEQMLETLRRPASRRSKGASPDPFQSLSHSDRVALQDQLRRAGEFAALKETARHWAMRSLALVREALVALGNRTGLDDNIFYISLEEMDRLPTEREELATAAENRRREAEWFLSFSDVDSTSELGVRDLERLGRGHRDAGAANGEMQGTFASGETTVSGIARVHLAGDTPPTLADNEILVAPYTDTSLAPLFAQARGLVTEVGGMLSHAAIVAREFHLPAIVGVSGATTRIQTGDRIRLLEDGRVEVIERGCARVLRSDEDGDIKAAVYTKAS